MSFMGGEAAPPLMADTAPPVVASPPAEDPFAGMPASTGMGKAIPNMTPLREWEDKHEKELEESTRQEQADKQATRSAAADELTKWYEERKDSIQKKAASNRRDEVSIEEARQAALKP